MGFTIVGEKFSMYFFSREKLCRKLCNNNKKSFEFIALSLGD